MRRKPNFFIVGAPKCGTTALSEYLRRHPNLFFTDPKEPHYFLFDYPYRRHTHSLPQYMDMFAKQTKKHTAIGEGSIWYLFSKLAIKNIIDYNDKAKIIVMLRNPVEMVYSMHSQFIYSRTEYIRDFRKAWEVQGERLRGRFIHKSNPPHPDFLQYKSIAKYGDQLERLYRYCSKDMVKIILYDDFKCNTKIVYDETLEFLGLEPFRMNEFSKINVNKTWRNLDLAMFTARPPKSLMKLVDAFKAVTGIKRLGLNVMIQNINTSVKIRKPLSDEMRSVLIEEYKNDITKLSGIIGRDLSNWTN